MATARGFSARQGDHDGLCGLYSLVNAISLMSKGRIKQAPLMEAMIDYLGSQGLLADTFNKGATRSRMKQLLIVARRHCEANGLTLMWSPPLVNRSRRGETRSLDEFWEAMTANQRRGGEGSIIIGLAGRNLHWSCVRKVCPRSLNMADSANENQVQMARIDRRFCTTGQASAQQPHILEEAFLLRLI